MLHETKVLLDRATPLERSGQWGSAIELCREAFQKSVSETDPENLVESVLRSGLCYRQMGETEIAIEYLELARTVSELRGDRSRASRALNGLATLHHMHGELQAAEVYYLEARAVAQQVGDLRTTGNIDQNLGALAVVRGNSAGALEHYQSALESYRDIGHERGVAGVLNNMGPLYISLREFDSAAECLQDALAVCRKIGDIISEGIVHINRAELSLLRGELDKARDSCDEAFEIVSRLGEHANRVDVLTLYGIIYRETRKPYLAETHLREAVEVAASLNYPLEEAEAQGELAKVLREQDRNKEALQALNRAHELFSALQARHYQEEVDERIHQLEDDFLSLVRAWGESIEAKDRYTRGHCQRVADYACMIAARAGIQDRDLVWFRMGAFLHDVGKTEVPGEILNKPGRLTDEEREIIEQHTVIGDDILSSIEFPWDVRTMVRSHHERWDGRGYPDRLAAEHIPLTARILHIADVFDALTTTRSYRQPLTAEQAFQLMQDDHGSFDPHLFNIFTELFPEIKEQVGGEESRRNGDEPHA